MKDSVSISDRLKQERLERGVSVADLAERSGVSQPHIWQIESGRRKNPGGATLQKLAGALGVGVEELLSGPKELLDEDVQELSESLREFITKRGKALGIRKEDVRMLKHISYRGRRPENIQDWELIFVFLQRMLST